ncbi:MAG TPA: methionyl-tRNA formyltransferase [Acidiferrobacteraceae bacterium]|nr:methionyl-tRNA formyltransferase [Acidiferrobacteraceae bacterium]
MPLRIVFAGTPEFALASLVAIHESEHELRAVYTQPDRPAGRGRAPRASAVKAYAQEHHLSCYQPQTFSAQISPLVSLGVDVMVVVAYGLILPAAILAIPRLGCINVHASLLPRWRGAAPIQRAIAAGDTATGISIMQMDPGLDTGAILAQRKIDIREDHTAGMLHDELAQLGAQVLVGTLGQLEDGKLVARAQDDAEACYAPKLTKTEAQIDWSRPADELARQVRALNPWPVAWTRWSGQVMRIWQAQPTVLTGGTPSGAPGAILRADAEGLCIATAEGGLLIERLQMPGGRPMALPEFLNGHKLKPGDVLGA